MTATGTAAAAGWTFERGRTWKREVVASDGVVSSNHPMASAAGVELLAGGGNAIDAAVGTLFALTVVEPMMVTPFGAGFFLVRDGRTGETAAIDNYALVPLAAHETMYRAIPGSLDYETEGKENDVGYRAIATPGNLKGWAHALARFGTMPLARVMAPAIRFAELGFPASAYMVNWLRREHAAVARFPATAAQFLPGGVPPAVGQAIVRTDYARTLRQIAEEGPETMYTGDLARRIVADMERNGGLITMDDLAAYSLHERTPVRGTYRGHEIVSMCPPSSGGTHIIQILNLLEAFPFGAGDLAFGAPDAVHLFAEALKIAFADRRRFMADPDRTHIPVDGLISKAYADRRRPEIDRARAGDPAHGDFPEVARFLGGEGENTTHLTVIDRDGTIVTATQTAHAVFGSKVTVPGTGMIMNNLMNLMDPTPGNTNSIAPGKRILSSMSPTIVLRDGAPLMALGTPGGKRIFAAVTQGIMNVLDHGMTLQEAVEAPRCWTQGADLEIEDVYPDLGRLRAELERRGHRVKVVEKVAGGMNGVLVNGDGLFHGAACWRADGAPAGLSGGPARPLDSVGVPE